MTKGLGTRHFRIDWSLGLGHWSFFHSAFDLHHLAGCLGNKRSGFVKQLRLGEQKPALFAGHSAVAFERAAGLDRFAVANRHLRRDAVATGVSASPGEQFVEDGRDDAAVGDALPAGEVLRQNVVEFDAFGRLLDVELETLRVVFAAGEAAAGVLKQLGFSTLYFDSSTGTPLGGVYLNIDGESSGFHSWLYKLK